MDTTFRLIKTKLYRPLPGRDFLRRQRLIDLLDSGSSLPLTLIAAPAGSGKTTLLSDWLAACSCPNAWLSLDEGDHDQRVFLSYFVAAIRTVFPDACSGVLAMLQAPELPPQHVLAAALSNEIDNLRDEPALAAGQRLVLALDDYHLLHSPAVDELLIALLRHPSPALRLILASRSDPALPLPAWRARGQLLEIRYHQLRFDAGETAQYLHQTLGVPPSEEASAALVQRTEGWITALHLASIYARHAPNPDDLLSGVQVGDRHAMDFLVSEVLALLPAGLQDFLLKTAILDRLCGPLAEAVTGVEDPVCDGRAHLEWLEHANLFITALDDQWYRYHHLLQRLMQSRLHRQFSGPQIAELHRRASAWFASQGLVEEAIAHALAAGDETTAVQIVAARRHEAMNHERWALLERWLHLMPRQLVDRQPELLLTEAWILVKQWRMLDLATYIDRVESLLPPRDLQQPETSLLRSECDVLRSAVCYYLHDGEQGHQLASRALQTVPMAHSAVRGLAHMYSGAGLQSSGDLQGGIRMLHDGLKEDAQHGNAFPSRPLTALCSAYWISGDMHALRQTANHFLRLAEERALMESVGWAHYFLGCAAYQMNELAAAEHDFSAVVGMRYLTNGLPFSQSAFGLASVWLAQGVAEPARALVQSVIDYGLEAANTRVLEDARAFQARLALKEGRRAEACRWAEEVRHSLSNPPMITFQVASLTLAEVLQDEGTAVSQSEAGRLLTRLLGLAEQGGNVRVQIEVLALHALLDDALGRQDAALAHLQTALALAQPGGLVRVFIDLGAPMARLLNLLVRQDPAAAWVAELLQAFPSPTSFPVRPSPPPPALIEPLTFREQEILALLAQRLSAKEIAQQLVISDRTVKRHAANIYQKLGVHSRQQAVAAAAAHGLLRPA